MHSVDDAEARDPGFADFWGHPRPFWMLLGVTVGLNFAFYGFRAYLAPYIEHFFAALGPAAAQKQADLISSGFLALTNPNVSRATFRAPERFAGKARSRRRSVPTASGRNAAGGPLRGSLRAGLGRVACCVACA